MAPNRTSALNACVLSPSNAVSRNTKYATGTLTSTLCSVKGDVYDSKNMQMFWSSVRLVKTSWVGVVQLAEITAERFLRNACKVTKKLRERCFQTQTARFKAARKISGIKSKISIQRYGVNEDISECPGFLHRDIMSDNNVHETPDILREYSDGAPLRQPGLVKNCIAAQATIDFNPVSGSLNNNYSLARPSGIGCTSGITNRIEFDACNEGNPHDPSVSRAYCGQPTSLVSEKMQVFLLFNTILLHELSSDAGRRE